MVHFTLRILCCITHVVEVALYDMPNLALHITLFVVLPVGLYELYVDLRIAKDVPLHVSLLAFDVGGNFE